MKIFRFVLVAMLLVIGLGETASAFAQPRYHHRPYYRHHHRHHYHHHR